MNLDEFSRDVEASSGKSCRILGFQILLRRHPCAQVAVWVPRYLDGRFLFILESLVGKLPMFIPKKLSLDPHNLALAGPFFFTPELSTEEYPFHRHPPSIF